MSYYNDVCYVSRLVKILESRVLKILKKFKSTLNMLKLVTEDSNESGNIIKKRKLK